MDFQPAKKNCRASLVADREEPSLMGHQRPNPQLFRPLPLFQSNATQLVPPPAHRNLFLHKTLGVHDGTISAWVTGVGYYFGSGIQPSMPHGPHPHAPCSQIPYMRNVTPYYRGRRQLRPNVIVPLCGSFFFPTFISPTKDQGSATAAPMAKTT